MTAPTNATPGSPWTATGSIGVVSAVGNWTASVSLSAFTNKDVPTAEPVSVAGATYRAGAASCVSALGLPLNRTIAPTTVTVASSPRDFRSSPSGLGSLVCLADWDFALTLPLPPTMLAGRYAGVLTHSVA
ncbi:hypothetical protein [Rhodococcoides kroppenstedtii]|uniref:hypothetical protein n=1 Tax=Rhodococcoides kroppenstedtii TaxID=293050 RepID=UPI00363AFCF5